PSTEAALPEARSGLFAGCISATANLNADLCARGYHAGDAGALAEAVAIRKLFDGKPLVPGVKALLAHIHGDPQWARVEPPLADFPAAHRAAIIAGYEAGRAERVAYAGECDGPAAGRVGLPPTVDADAAAPYKPRFLTISCIRYVWRTRNPQRKLPVRPSAEPLSIRRDARACAARSARWRKRSPRATALAPSPRWLTRSRL